MIHGSDFMLVELVKKLANLLINIRPVTGVGGLCIDRESINTRMTFIPPKARVVQLVLSPTKIRYLDLLGLSNPDYKS